MAARPFHAETWDLGGGARLVPVTAGAATEIAAAMTAIDPWRRLGTDRDALAAFLTADDPHCCRRAIQIDGAAAGVVAVRSPWLYGPYLSLLAVLPPRQGNGVGARVLDWLATEAVAGGNRNVWVCTSSFNARAQAFYAAHGFVRVGVLDDLLVDGVGEVLLRRRL